MLGRPADAQQRADVLAFVKSYEATLPSDMKPDERRLRSLDQRLPGAARLGRVPVRVLTT